MERRKAVWLGASVVPSLVLLILPPFGMSLRQTGVTAALLLVLIWWATGLVERTLAAGALLVAFLLFSGAPVKTVLVFPLSENFIVISASFLFSQGVINSGLAGRVLEPWLCRYARTPARLLCAMVLCSAVVMCFVPQSISRVIIVAAIFSRFFDRLGLERELKSVLMFGLFSSSIFMGLLFIRGDLVLNYGLIMVSGLELTETEWIRYLTVPTAVFVLLSVLLYAGRFRKELCGYSLSRSEPCEREPMSRQERGRLAFLLLVAVLWATEQVHGISGAWIVCGGTLLMAPLGLLGWKDLRVINVRLLIFLTAAFSIGGVIRYCGIADLLFTKIINLFPAVFSPMYALAVMLTAMALHMLLGSNVTTISVVVPGLLAASAGVAPPIFLCFLTYIAVGGHFLLPYHHVTLAVGEGMDYFSTKHVLRYGWALTLLTLFTGMVLYLGWWSLIGISP